MFAVCGWLTGCNTTWMTNQRYTREATKRNSEAREKNKIKVPLKHTHTPDGRSGWMELVSMDEMVWLAGVLVVVMVSIVVTKGNTQLDDHNDDDDHPKTNTHFPNGNECLHSGLLCCTSAVLDGLHRFFSREKIGWFRRFLVLQRFQWSAGSTRARVWNSESDWGQAWKRNRTKLNKHRSSSTIVWLLLPPLQFGWPGWFVDAIVFDRVLRSVGSNTINGDQRGEKEHRTA